ncbi:MAG: hypothetical protein ACKO2G_14775 [Verrucomicrobiales bacterium]
MTARANFFRIFAVLLLALPLPAKDASFAGKWESTFGELSISEEAGNVTGSYQIANLLVGELQGKVSGATLTFTYAEGEITGEGQFSMAEDGRSFTGRWREKDKEDWQAWSGKRMEPANPGFNGVWKTNLGPVRLIEKQNQVIGCYQSDGQAEIEGTADNGLFKFTFREPSGKGGTGEFKLEEDGASFSGTWKNEDGSPGGEWSGTKIPPTKGRSWLIILEAHWENSLQEAEYSYGNMLQQFFTRVPEVEIRHRFFDEKEDFAKWCSELPYLNEPTVLYVSSHGKEEGITVDGHVLDGEFIGRQLRYAPEIKLVHLGACLAMAGKVPHEIRKAADGHFPVSGFTKTADWAGSAVVDFAYLDLVLSRGIKPGDAVRQMRKNVTFATEKSKPGCIIPPMDLKIVE